MTSTEQAGTGDKLQLSIQFEVLSTTEHQYQWWTTDCHEAREHHTSWRVLVQGISAWLMSMQVTKLKWRLILECLFCWWTLLVVMAVMFISNCNHRSRTISIMTDFLILITEDKFYLNSDNAFTFSQDEMLAPLDTNNLICFLQAFYGKFQWLLMARLNGFLQVSVASYSKFQDSV